MTSYMNNVRWFEGRGLLTLPTDMSIKIFYVNCSISIFMLSCFYLFSYAVCTLTIKQHSTWDKIINVRANIQGFLRGEVLVR